MRYSLSIYCLNYFNPYFERHSVLEHTSKLQDLGKKSETPLQYEAIYSLMNYFISEEPILQVIRLAERSYRATVTRNIRSDRNVHPL